VPCQQHAIHRLDRGHLFVAARREDDLLDQFIDRRIGNARIVARALLVGGGRAPVVGLLVAGVHRLAQTFQIMS
jgi:hypothetical protein